MNLPRTLSRDISPPPRLLKRRQTSPRNTPLRTQDNTTAPPSLAAVEAGRAKVEDHLAYFKEHLSKSRRKDDGADPRIDIDAWADLYVQNQHEHGNHFVIHQHNHPISGVHYDLRLQFSETSSLSFALPKGLPGNPNSKSLGRMAIETRVHNLWNHLIESASSKTGSLIIWDSGSYTVLPRKNKHKLPPSPQTTDDEMDSGPQSPPEKAAEMRPDNEKLKEAFRSKYIRLRLNGVRLPKDYTVTLRLPFANDFGKPQNRATIRNRRRRPRQLQAQVRTDSTDSEEGLQPQQKEEVDEDIDTDAEEDAQTRLTNAYPGSTNSIGSVHQRRWFILLDRASSGFVRDAGTGLWVRQATRDREGFEPFFVRGRDFERSVVTGRLAREVEQDEGVTGFVGRSGWVGITT